MTCGQGGIRCSCRPPKLSIGPPHPDPIVETSSLSAVQPPEPTYDLRIKEELEESKALSCLQIETLVYACQRHLQHLADGTRAGFFVGDGAGVGKGRTIAGLIWENWKHGRRKALWISVGSDLKYDARRDLDDVGATCVGVNPLNKLPYSKLDSKNVGVKDGVVFLTYNSLIASSEKGRSRLQQLVQWCGPDFDGLLIFDECASMPCVCHKAKNLVPEAGSQPTRIGQAVVDIQRPPKLSIGPPHPDPIVETSSLSAVQPPEPTYDLRIKEELEESKALSCLQIETLVYACQRHLQHLADGTRAGFFVGDGAGVGKGRTIAGLIWENWKHGRRKALWISVGSDLKYDARRDLDDVGATCVGVNPLNKLPYSKLDSKNVGVKDGVVFLTYNSLIASSEKGRSRLQQLVQWCGPDFDVNPLNKLPYSKLDSKNVGVKDGVVFLTYNSLIASSEKGRSRLQQLVQWCGPDFDGLLIFDECASMPCVCHKAKNLVPEAGSQPTRIGQAVVDIQDKIPQARVLYCSATGASEPRNMGYMVRLGLWGAGTSFSDFSKFLGALDKGGVGALELVAMDMKARGMYVCRTLSYKGAEFEIVEAPLEAGMENVLSDYQLCSVCYLVTLWVLRAVNPLNKLPYSKLDSKNVGVKDGVVFLTYNSLIASSEKGRSRLQQLVQWCGPDFDGLLIFDECHKAKNLVPEAGSQPTRIGQAVVDIQDKIPQARVLYCSATGASEPRNMGYMVRLGLWGAGTSFSDFSKFLGALDKGGVGALELVAMDMKARGMYVCRTLSYKGAEFEIVEAPLEAGMEAMYNKSAEFWAELRIEMLSANAFLPNEKPNSSQLWRLYWSSHQRFFRHLCMSAKVPVTVRLAKKALLANKCVVIGLQSTGEARTEEAVTKYARQSHKRIRVIRIETTTDNQRIVGLSIPNAAVETVLQDLAWVQEIDD
ncbi:hypothetical protein DY000_02064315 [Brassica cretica]|uniref:Strawberry notch AAA domain-containing protein n=1 Tax=Brassica cretica TaxID=69181 RepID=A0ABQ7AY96_BRACR|nr:hypothetical protein DY000_02064315 [Brassica cretica]